MSDCECYLLMYIHFDYLVIYIYILTRSLYFLLFTVISPCLFSLLAKAHDQAVLIQNPYQISLHMYQEKTQLNPNSTTNSNLFFRYPKSKDKVICRVDSMRIFCV